MLEYDTLKHHISRKIINHLQTHEYARFTDMRPKGVDTNLFTYHLKQLSKNSFITKTDQGYTLGEKGLTYVDRVSSDKMKLRSQPKIITMLFVRNSGGQLLVQKRNKQPYINTWTLPYGKIHIDDMTVLDAALRESKEKLQYIPSGEVAHIGDCYIVVLSKKSAAHPEQAVQSRTLAHIVTFAADDIRSGNDTKWVDSTELASLHTAPAVREIVKKARESKTFFFEEFKIELQ